MANIKTSIQPWLSVGNCAKAGAFYKEAFGADETYRMESPDGGLVLKLSVDEAEFWVSGQSTDTDKTIATTLKQDVIKILLVVESPDVIFEQAIKAGASEVFSVGENYGWRLGRLTDPFGLDWEIGKQLIEK
jgi:PhnB protein